MNVREGTHILYVMQVRWVASARGADGPFEQAVDDGWFWASQDSFGFPDGDQAWQKTGEYGWLDLTDAKKALDWARDKSDKGGFVNKDGYGRVESRTKYEFRLCEIFMVRRDRVLDL